MNCNCKWLEIVLGIIVIVFAFWQTMYSQWIIIIAAILLIIHALTCKNCGPCSNCSVKGQMPKPARKAAKKKRR